MKSERFTAEIHDLAFGGDGVGTAPDGRTLFVPFTIPGEEVEVEIVAAKKSWARAALCEVRRASPDRVAPVCQYFGRCGGCQCQHIDYPRQVALKQKQLTDTLERLGRLEGLPEVSPAAASPLAFGYRNKLTLEGFTTAEGKRDFGFFSPVSREFFSVESCPLAHPEINALIAEAKRQALARQSPTAGGEADRLLFRRPASGSAHFYTDLHPRLDWLAEELNGRPVRVPPQSFWQVNPPLGQRLAACVAEWCGARAPEIMIDAYAGVGLFSLAAGPAVSRAYLVETDRLAVKAAAWNHLHWGVKGREFMTARAEKALPQILDDVKKSGKLADCVLVLDPPRTGCPPELLGAVADRRPGSVVYVSCNPATLARDLRQLCQADGYRVERLAFFDMFPQTAHFETVALLVAGG